MIGSLFLTLRREELNVGASIKFGRKLQENLMLKVSCLHVFNCNSYTVHRLETVSGTHRRESSEPVPDMCGAMCKRDTAGTSWQSLVDTPFCLCADSRPAVGIMIRGDAKMQSILYIINTIYLSGK